MRDFFTGKKIKIIAAVCLVLIGSMIYSVSRGGEASYLESFFGALTVPFQKANAAIVNGLSDFFVKIGDYDRLKEENEMLHATALNAIDAGTRCFRRRTSSSKRASGSPTG